uniref:rRNA adenine N(6)-methyltransferase n=1 Tax=Pipistrellus kuhlii TaxID=59472 RepID=A0A7J7TQ64_PIPKU|nr:transcription factor B2, mitochondrial [Pipistrellus kuhlii]
MWAPMAGLSPRLALPAFAGATRLCLWRSGAAAAAAARWKGVPARSRRSLSGFPPKLAPREGLRDLPPGVPRSRLESKRYVLSPSLAETVARLLLRDDGCDLILEINPGIPLKVVGIFPTKNEKKMIWKVLHDIYSCTSIYRYGRVQLNLFFNELESQRMMANPQNPNLYYALSVLWQVAYDVKLLHVEPWSSFDISSQSVQQEKPQSKESSEQQVQQNLCLIQLTPHKDLFSQQLTSVNYDVFFHMTKQCFLKRHGKLIDHLTSLSPIDAMDILKEMDQDKNIKIIDMYPSDFKCLFETIECSKDHTFKWLYDDFMEDVII